MANYHAIKAAVNAYIKRNGRKEITGTILNSVLNATIDSLGRFFQFAGMASPSVDPGTPDQNVCYLAGEPGVYTHFGGITLGNEEIALLFWDGEWTKQGVLIGIQEVNASVDNQSGTPSVDVGYTEGVLTLTFHNLKGDPGTPGTPGAAAGFGTVDADVDGNIGTPGVTVQTSGPDTAKNLMFHFTNLKGETGVTSVVATVDNTSGTPSCQVTLVGQQLTLAFSGLKGLKGDTGVSADYPITIYNGLDSDATDAALAAAQGKVLQGEITELEAKVTDLRESVNQDIGFEVESFTYGAAGEKEAYIEPATYVVTNTGQTQVTVSFRKTQSGTSYNITTLAIGATAEITSEDTYHWIRCGGAGSFTIKKKVNVVDFVEETRKGLSNEDARIKQLVSGDAKTFVFASAGQQEFPTEIGTQYKVTNTGNSAVTISFRETKSGTSYNTTQIAVGKSEFVTSSIKGNWIRCGGAGSFTIEATNLETRATNLEASMLLALDITPVSGYGVDYTDGTLVANNAMSYVELTGVGDYVFVRFSGTRSATGLGYGFFVNDVWQGYVIDSGDSVQEVKLAVPAGATRALISWNNILVSEQAVSVLRKDALQYINDKIDNTAPGGDFSKLEGWIPKDVALLDNKGILLSDGSFQSSTNYTSVEIDVANIDIAKIRFCRTYAGASNATYAFGSNGVFTCERYTNQTTPSWADIDVPEGTDTIRIAWNKNFQDTDKTVFLKTALNTTEIVKLVDESASFPTAFQFQVDFDLSRIPALTCPSNSVIDSTNLSAVYDRYDALVSAYPDYVTKVDCMSEANSALGLETPSELDGMNIYMYKFSPIRARGNSTAYSSDVGSRINVLLTTNHPNERFGLHTLFEVMNHICNDWATDVNADMLRSLIDIYVIPIPWPWDYVNNSRTNYNGVNPNRNFPTEGWAVSGAGTSDYTGAEPLSEYEAKVLAYFVAQIKPKVFLDVHTSGNDNAGCMGITERPSGKYSQYLRDLFGIAARTMSNRAIQDNPNYPSNPNNSIYGAYNMTMIGGLFQYVYEQGCIYSTISEQSDYSNWLNGVFQGTGSTHIEQRTNGIYRQQTQWLFNLILRMTFAACQRFYQFECRI